MQSITVLHLIPTLSSGGAERQLANLVCNTSSNALRHIVCTIRDPDFFAPQIRATGCEVIDFGISGKHPLIRASLAFRRILVEKRPTVIHSWLYDANVATRFAQYTYGKVPQITSLQLPDYSPDAISFGNWNPRKVRALKLLDQLTAWLTDPYYVACSEFVRDSYLQHFRSSPDRMVVIFNSFDPEALRNSEGSITELENEFNLPSDAFVLLNVGRLDPQKNQKILLEAFRRVATKIPEAYLLIVGNGGLEDELQQYAESIGLDERIKFLGRRNDVGMLLEFADVFVFPSLFEGLGIALIEAMYKKLPCIASNIAVFREVISNGSSGFLIDPHSPEDLARSILELYFNDELRLNLGRTAYEQCIDKFSIEVSAKQWEKLYREIARAYGVS